MSKRTLNKKTLDGNVETLILAVLREGPSYGYQIVTDLNKMGGGLLELGEGTIYPVLHRMEDRELIEAKWQTAENGRQRKYYRITSAGRKALAANQAQWHGLVQVMSHIFGPPPEASEAPGRSEMPKGSRLKGVTS